MAAKRNNRLHDAASADANATRREDSGPLNRDILVIGASAGGVDALKRIVSNLSPDLRAAVFVVLHVGPTSYLPEILDRAGPLPAHKAANGVAYEPGNIYVAPPGFHLLVHDDHMMLRRGPREDLARPAIDPGGGKWRGGKRKKRKRLRGPRRIAMLPRRKTSPARSLASARRRGA